MIASAGFSSLMISGFFSSKIVVAFLKFLEEKRDAVEGGFGVKYFECKKILGRRKRDLLSFIVNSGIIIILIIN
jgi:hypothetical protein